MIHVVTAHHLVPDWIEIQRRYLDRFMVEPFILWGSLEGIDARYESFFDHVVPSLGNHAGKLNLLGRVVCEAADPDDIVIFLDGDAFPVGDAMAWVRQSLAHTRLTAVQRLENKGDTQPPPSFCATTVRFWRELPGDWSSGHEFAKGRTDVGANLAYALAAAREPWVPVHRSNTVDLHPVFFGVYGGFLYHHGAGFRPLKVARNDGSTRSAQERRRVAKIGAAIGEEKLAEKVERSLENTALSDRVYARILADDDFFRDFLE